LRIVEAASFEMAAMVVSVVIAAVMLSAFGERRRTAAMRRSFVRES
jgi:hypothetical protein